MRTFIYSSMFLYLAVFLTLNGKCTFDAELCPEPKIDGTITKTHLRAATLSCAFKSQCLLTVSETNKTCGDPE